MFLFSIGALTIFSSLLIATSCLKQSGDGNDNEKPIEQPNKPQTNETFSKGLIPKELFGFETTVENNSYKITKEWILENKAKLLNGSIDLFTSQRWYIRVWC